MNTTTKTHANCLRCGRALTSPASVRTGYGRTCTAKVRQAAKIVDLHAYKAEQLAKAAELIEDGAIVRLRGRIYLAVSSDGSETYRTAATGQCNCPAGLKSRTCFHTAAARILTAA